MDANRKQLFWYRPEGLQAWSTNNIQLPVECSQIFCGSICDSKVIWLPSEEVDNIALRWEQIPNCRTEVSEMIIS